MQYKPKMLLVLLLAASALAAALAAAIETKRGVDQNGPKAVPQQFIRIWRLGDSDDEVAQLVNRPLGL